MPERLFLFGTDDIGQPDSVVPLVHLPVWPFGALSEDSSEDSKEGQVTLPLVPLIPSAITRT